MGVERELQGFDWPAAEILERMSEGFYAIDGTWRIRYVNRSAEGFWQRPRADLVGRSMFDLFPGFAGSPAHAAHVQAISEQAPLQAEVISTATRLPVELNLYPDGDGLAVFFYDISRRVDLEERLGERDDLLTLAEAAAGIGVWDYALSSGLVRGTPQFFRLHALEPSEDAVPYDLIVASHHPEDRARVASGFAEALAGGAGTHEVEYRVVRPDGDQCWIFSRGRIIRNTEGEPVRYAGVDLDTTNRKRQEDQLRLMAHELRHRANNLLAVVQAMARQTVRASADLGDFEARFEGRVRALANSNDLLVNQDWRGVPLETLIETLLQPFVERDTSRVSVSGVSVVLLPKAVQTLGLALHELATNASKYGALSVPGGTVSISWTLVRGAGTQLHMRWKEQNGPPVVQPERSGFGRFVTERMVSQSLDGEVNVTFAHDGLSWSLTCPTAGVLAE